MNENPAQAKQVQQSNQQDEGARIEAELAEALEDQTLAPDIRKTLETQLKMVKLRSLQQQTRNQVLQNYLTGKVRLQSFKAQTAGDFLYERELVHREFYKRSKIPGQGKKEARTLDRFEQQMRSGQELRKKTRHKELMNEILFHASKFQEFHKKKYTYSKKKAYGVRTHLDSKEKKEQLAKDKEERERIKALREKKFDVYINLINSQKNERLLEILDQTHKYLEQLGAKVNTQKKDNQHLKRKKGVQGGADEGEGEDGEGHGQGDEEEKGEGDGDDEFMNNTDKIKKNLLNSSKYYYSITHTVQEEITEQPEML